MTGTNSSRTPRKRTTREAAVRPHKRTLSFGGLTVSVRLIGIMAVTGLLAVMLSSSLVQWWRQEQDLRDIQARVVAAQERNAQMEAELERWQDPEYVAMQARARLGYVRPGETQYAVVDPGPGHEEAGKVAPAEAQGPPKPWIQIFTTTLAEADAPLE